MFPFSTYPSLLQYTQNYSQTQQFWHHYYAFQQQHCINNFFLRNSLNANYELNNSPKTSNIQIKMENQEISEQTQNDKKHFEPVEIPQSPNCTNSPNLTQKIVKQYPQIKKKKGKKSNQKKTFNTGHWTKKEHRLYLSFIEMRKDVMKSSDLKKTQKIFKQMSHYIKTRSPCQCRSHHQKFETTTQNILGRTISQDMDGKF